MRAAIYVRVSRAPDTETDTSTPRQAANCRAFLAARDWTEAAIYSDVDRSAYRDGVVRDGFEALLTAITSGGIDVVVVWKLDRLTRRSRDFERLWALCEQHDVSVVSVTEPVDTTTPIGLAIVRVLLTFASVESSVRGERVAARFRENAQRGQPFAGGRRPFGHTIDLARLVETEAELLREAARRVVNAEPLASVARDFQARGIVGGHGVPWTAQGLRSTLLSARMVGDRSYRRTVVATDCFAPILDRDVHRLVTAMLTETPKRSRPTRSLLQGLLLCGRCGQTLVSSVTIRGRHIYKCPQPPQGCQRLNVTAAGAEQVVVAAARAALRTRGRGDHGEVVSASPRLHDLNRAYFVDQSISRSEWYDTRAGIVGHDQTQRHRWRLHPDIPTDATARQLDKGWDLLPRAAQRALISSVLEAVVVDPRPKGARFDETRLRLQWTGRSS